MFSLKKWLLFLLWVPNCFAITIYMFEKKCGEYKYIIKTTASYSEIKQYVEKDNKEIFFYTSDFLSTIDATCITNAKGKILFLFSMSCLQTDCTDENFGLYDPEREKMLLTPTEDETNIVEIKNILGYEPNFDQLYEDAFCCSKEMIE